MLDLDMREKKSRFKIGTMQRSVSEAKTRVQFTRSTVRLKLCLFALYVFC
jgi:hypothetical protein